MVRIYTLTLFAPSLDSATITPQIYPEGKLRCTAPVSNPEVAASTSPAPLPILEAVPQRYLPAGGATGEHLVFTVGR